MALARAALLAALIPAACTAEPPGRKLAGGIASGLIAQNGAVAFLLGAGHPDDPGVPEDLLVGDLWLDARKVGRRVSSQTGSYLFSPRGELAFLADRHFRSGEGELWTAVPGSEPQQVAAKVRAFSWSPDGSRLAYAGEDGFGIRGAPAHPAAGLQTIAWAPDGAHLAARTSSASGGKLYVLDVASGAVRQAASETSDFAFAPDGALAILGASPPKGGDRALRIEGREVARATDFGFSPDGKKLALLSTGKRAGEAYGDLYELSRSPGSKPALVGERVSEWRYAPSGELLCLARYDLRARSGALRIAGREIAARVQTFSIHGPRVLYLVQAPQKGDFRIELWAANLDGGAEPRKIDEGVYGWDVSRDGGLLFYKARCAGGPRSCSLFRRSFAADSPVLLASSVAGFDLSRDGSRILVQQPHRGAPRAVDLAVLAADAAPAYPLQPFVEQVDPSSRFADATGRRVAYAIVLAQKGGVFLADIP